MSAVMTSVSQAKTTACKAIIQGFSSDTANLGDMQQFASCVQYLYPETLSGEATLWVKFFIVMGLLGIVIGIVNGAGRGHNDWADTLGMAFVGMLVMPACAAVCVAIYYAVRFLIQG